MRPNVEDSSDVLTDFFDWIVHQLSQTYTAKGTARKRRLGELATKLSFNQSGRKEYATNWTGNVRDVNVTKRVRYRTPTRSYTSDNTNGHRLQAQPQKKNNDFVYAIIWLIA